MKTAIFCEGQAEQIFVHQLIEALANEKHLHIVSTRIGGGRRCEVYVITVSEVGDPSAHDSHFLIVDCSGDNRVSSEILDQYETLIEREYQVIIGVRDLRPEFTRGELPDLLRGFDAVMPTQPVKPMLIVPVMEIEAWFLSQPAHFSNIDPRLTNALVVGALGIDYEQPGEGERRNTPADDLLAVYALVQVDYDKSRAAVERTVKSMNLVAFAQEVDHKSPSARLLVERLLLILR